MDILLLLAVEKSPAECKRPRNLEITMHPLGRKSNPKLLVRLDRRESTQPDFWPCIGRECNRLQHRYKMFV